ncbi:hypothetical protein H5P36_16145 [Bacillus sp. APMAM]|uniref:hypothetical protein n=1 Tax=Margalitia sp. FSL K6-0131 TaxID=2954604 RepID=UPI000F889D90|nr:hypothetical protein [Bacillus sp. APMAM]RTZ54904.1 hypothetical protein EKO25_15390 [Bacillus sp. SAJ1]
MSEIKFIPKKMLLLLIIYFIVIDVVSILSVDKVFSNSLFDYIVNLRWGGSAGMMPIILGVLPVLAILFPLLIDKMEMDMYVLRIENKRKLFYNHLIFAIMASAFFTLFMVLSGIIASFIATGNVHNLWGTKDGMVYFLLDNKDYFSIYLPHVTSMKVWLYIISSRFLAILCITLFIILLKSFLKKNIYVFFVSWIFLGIDGFFSNQFTLFLGRASITLETWISPSDQLFNLVYFMLGIVIFYYICIKLYDKKEFFD